MLGADLLIIAVKLTVFLVYGSVFIVSCIFTFFIDTYLKIDELFNIEFLSQKIVTPLEINIKTLDDWLIENHQIVGPLLILLSLTDIFLIFQTIDLL